MPDTITTALQRIQEKMKAIISIAQDTKADWGTPDEMIFALEDITEKALEVEQVCEQVYAKLGQLENMI